MTAARTRPSQSEGVSRPPAPTAGVARVVPEAEIVDYLCLAGWVFENEASGAEVRARAAAVLRRFVAAGLPCRKTDDGLCFDPVETLNFIKSLGLEGRDPFWADRFVATGRRLVTDAERAGAGRDATKAARFEVELRRVFNLAGLDRRKPLRLRAPLPLKRSGVSELDVLAASCGPLAVRVEPNLGRLEARGLLPLSDLAVLSARCTIAVDPSAAVDDDPASYLAEQEGLIAVTPRVRDLAARLIPQGADVEDVLLAVWNHLLDELRLGAVPYEHFSASAPALDWALETGWCDCQLGAALFAALCRARGIAARICGGYLLYPRAPTPHFWAEAWVGEGWRPFDLASWDLSAGGADTEWRNYFAGRLDARVMTQIAPLVFTGAPGVPVPHAWRILSTPLAGGAATTLYCAESGRMIYRDEILVTRLGRG